MSVMTDWLAAQWKTVPEAVEVNVFWWGWRSNDRFWCEKCEQSFCCIKQWCLHIFLILW